MAGNVRYHVEINGKRYREVTKIHIDRYNVSISFYPAYESVCLNTITVPADSDIKISYESTLDTKNDKDA